MRKRLSLVLICAVLCLSGACQSSDSIEPDGARKVPEDFAFSLKFGAMALNGIDTYNGTLTKDLIEAGTEAISYTLPAEQKALIYDAFVAADIPSIEKSVLNSMWSKPPLAFVFAYTCDGVTKEINCFDNPDEDEDEVTTRFLAFARGIVQYVQGTAEWKNMPEAVGSYR